MAAMRAIVSSSLLTPTLNSVFEVGASGTPVNVMPSVSQVTLEPTLMTLPFTMVP